MASDVPVRPGPLLFSPVCRCSVSPELNGGLGVLTCTEQRTKVWRELLQHVGIMTHSGKPADPTDPGGTQKQNVRLPKALFVLVAIVTS